MNITRIAIVAALASIGSLAFAADESANIAVSASVSGICRLTAPATLTVPAIDPSGTGAATATASVSFKCTKNKAYTFTVNTESDGSVTGNLTGPAAETLAYTATWTQPSGTGIGFSTAVNANVAVSIAQLAYQDASAGAYTGSVAVNINY